MSTASNGYLWRLRTWGYDSVWVHDHVTYDTDWFAHRGSGLIEQCEGIEPDLYESLCTLTWIAGFTERVKLGTAILVLPLRDPRVLARQAMTLQALSKNRLLLGVGIGDYPSDFQVMGIPYKDKTSLTDEYLQVLGTIFQGGNVSHNGATISFENAAYFPRGGTHTDHARWRNRISRQGRPPPTLRPHAQEGGQMGPWLASGRAS